MFRTSVERIDSPHDTCEIHIGGSFDVQGSAGGVDGAATAPDSEEEISSTLVEGSRPRFLKPTGNMWRFPDCSKSQAIGQQCPDYRHNPRDSAACCVHGPRHQSLKPTQQQQLMQQWPQFAMLEQDSMDEVGLLVPLAVHVHIGASWSGK